MIHVIKGTAGSGKTTTAYDLLLKKAREHAGRNHILVVPEQSSIEAQRDIIDMSPGHGIINIDILSFNRLAYRIFSSCGGEECDLIDDSGKNLIIRYIADEVSDDLRVLKGELRKKGYITEVRSVISEFMQYGIKPEDIDRIAEASDSRSRYLTAKLMDIKLLYERFVRYMGERFMTREEILVRASAMAGEASFLKDSTLIFDQFTGFTPVQYTFIEALSGICADIYVTVMLPENDKRSLFELGRKTVSHLEDIAEKRGGLDIIGLGDDMRHEHTSSLYILGRNIFNTSLTGKSDGDGCVTFCMAEDPYSEVRDVMRKICDLVRNRGFRYKDCGIIMGDPSLYSEVISDMASRYDLPVYVDSTRRIGLNPFTELIRAVILILKEDHSYDSLMHLLRTGFTGIDREDIDLAENYILKLGIKGRRAYEKSFTESFKGVDPKEVEACERIRIRLNEILEPVLKLKNSSTVSDMTDGLLKICETLEIRQKLDDHAVMFEKQGMIEKSMEYSRVYDILMGQFENMKGLIGDQTVSVKEYLELYEDALYEVRVGVIPPLSDVVMAGDMTRSRFSHVRALFFVGMNEGTVPRPSAGAGLISDKDRELIMETGVEIAPTAAQSADTERFYFYMNLMTGSERVCFSYPVTSLDGSIQRESYFMKEARRVLGVKESGKGGDFDTVLSQDEMLTRFATSLREDEVRAALYLKSLMKSEGDKKEKASLDHITRRLRIRDEYTERLDSEASGRLFGQGFIDSPTELERFAACPYEHFLQYGLRLTERRVFEFEMRDVGIMLHKVLELYQRKLFMKSLSFGDVSDEVSQRILEEAVNDSVDAKYEMLFGSSARYAHMRDRLIRYAARSVKTLRFQAGAGDFRSVFAEKRFESYGLKGTIDRCDEMGLGDEVFVDVIDYKTGNKEFDPDRIYYGLDIQLPIYLKAAMELRSSYDGKRVRPAGLFYYHVDDPMIDGNRDSKSEYIEEQIHKQLKLRGIVNSDKRIIEAYDRTISETGRSMVVPVGYTRDGNFLKGSGVYTEGEIESLIDHTVKTSRDLREQILKGEASRTPYLLGKESGCDHCAYRTICDGGKKRVLKKHAFPEAWTMGDKD